MRLPSPGRMCYFFFGGRKARGLMFSMEGAVHEGGAAPWQGSGAGEGVPAV